MEPLADISDLLVDPSLDTHDEAPVDHTASVHSPSDVEKDPQRTPTDAVESEFQDDDSRPIYEPEISQWSSSEDEQVSEETTKSKPKARKKRKIADIIDEEDLEEDTLLAREEEKQRAKLFETADVLKNIGISKDGRICINPTPNGDVPTGSMGEPDAPVLIHPVLSEALKPHQVIGARFLWSHISSGSKGFGCILADFMGLGKTLQVITTVHTFLNVMTKDEDGAEVAKYNSVLILAPAICVRNWEAEFKKWLTHREISRMRLTTLDAEKTVTERLDAIIDWHNQGGVMVMGYEMYRNIVLQATGEEKLKAKSQGLKHRLDDALACLCSPGPDLIVLDEGHRIRDLKSKLVKSLGHIETRRRVILTGYPIQNHMKEYWTMVNFARPNYLGTLQEFKNRFVDPIENGQFEDSSDADIVLSRKRTFILTKELSTLVLRRDGEFLHRQLPPKHEYVLLCKLSPLQVKLYKAFLRSGVPKSSANKKLDVLGGYHISLAIVNHPDGIYNALPGKNTSQSNTPAPLVEEMDSDCEAVESVVRNLSHRLSFAEPIFPADYPTGIAEHSGKMVLLMHILRECRAIGDRITVFSQSIHSLNSIESILNNYNMNKKSYERIHSVRIDGSTPQALRFQRIAQFNDPTEDVDVILISTKAGGEGVNLCGGNRVVIFDVCWNPCHDAQSMCRSYRFGQIKPVYVYRLISAGTMEKKVYDLQVKKEGVSKRVVDNTALERKFLKQDVGKYFDIHDFKTAQTKLLNSDRNDVAMSKRDSDQVLGSVLNVRSHFLAEWFEQDSMFEENSAERCSELEQQEALHENEMTKAARGIQLHQVMSGTTSMKRSICPQCNYSNPVDELALKLKELTCCECDTSIDLSDPKRILTVSGSTHPEIALIQQQREQHAARLRELQMLNYHRMQTNSTSQDPIFKNVSNSRMELNQYQSDFLRGYQDPTQRSFPPSMNLFSHAHAGRRSQESIMIDDSPQRPQRRRVLFLRKGLDRTMVEELKNKAKENLNYYFEVELTTATTDIVSGMPLELVLRWLQRESLPQSVTLRPVEWLHDQIAPSHVTLLN